VKGNGARKNGPDKKIGGELGGNQGKIGKKFVVSLKKRRTGRNAFVKCDSSDVKEQLKNHGTDLIGFIYKKISNEADTSFWDDVLRGNVTFKSLYPRVYALESCKNVIVAVKLSHVNVGYFFRRIPRGGVEQVQFLVLLASMEGVALVDMRDTWVWSLEGSGEFFVASVRRLIDERWIHGEDGKLDKNVKHSHPSIWLDIVREIEQLKNHDTYLIGFIYRKISNEADTSFWDDVLRDKSSFGHVIGVGIMYMMSAGKAEINRLNTAVDETAKVVQELKAEISQRKSSGNFMAEATVNQKGMVIKP
nr:RNA-directed DNA polymerase, eukaryota, reverse transcriptase zinc-binding domain protein [Tanacetum cinerariifolium]